MRPTLSIAVFLASMFSLTAAAHAGGPNDPFAAAAATAAPQGDTPGETATAGAGLLDPFAAPPAAAPAPTRLGDPFSAPAAPACPVRTTGSGVVIQRPASADCRVPPASGGLMDPFSP